MSKNIRMSKVLSTISTLEELEDEIKSARQWITSDEVKVGYSKSIEEVK